MITQPSLRPLCQECKQLPAKSNGTSVRGYPLWQKLCHSCSKKKYVTVHKDDTCSQCGFVGVHSSQLCWVDGETVCLNCNALRLLSKKRRSELTVDADVNWQDIRL